MDEMRSVPMTKRWRINEAGLHCIGWATKAVTFRVLRPSPLPANVLYCRILRPQLMSRMKRRLGERIGRAFWG
ncbi:hypothetical protein MPL3365_170301 [Mesorhizobium plurifarium]|uniref:Uncharacterized protein n=1 Tax=Mesorhizobium plurifarium TaxID=69974 RepID=A0A090GTH1_MESPL|nr:hypothetical protein MPL3365_170301 [Mesorhizobium plurifarium]